MDIPALRQHEAGFAQDVLRHQAAGAAHRFGKPPRGIAQLASTAAQKIKLQGRSVRLAFACVAAGDCAPRAFRLSFSGGGALRVKSPALAAGKTGYVSIRLTRPSVSRITRAGYKGVRATLADYGRTQSQSLRIRR